MITRLFQSFVFVSFLLCNTPFLSGQVEFNLRPLDSENTSELNVYSIYAKNTETILPTLPATITSTINITIKLPGDYMIDDSHPDANTDITDLAHGLYREMASRNNPAYASESDYLYFTMTGLPTFPEWANEIDVEIELFQFSMKNGACEEGTFSIVEDSDPILFMDNERHQDFTNQFVTMTGGQYSGNYDNEFTNSCSSVSAEEAAFNASLFIYPNPAKGFTFLHYNFDEVLNLNIRILNNLGQNVFERDENTIKDGLLQLDISRFAAGLYYVYITDGKYEFRDQLFIENNQ